MKILEYIFSLLFGRKYVISILEKDEKDLRDKIDQLKLIESDLNYSILKIKEQKDKLSKFNITFDERVNYCHSINNGEELSNKQLSYFSQYLIDITFHDCARFDSSFYNLVYKPCQLLINNLFSLRAENEHIKSVYEIMKRDKS